MASYRQFWTRFLDRVHAEHPQWTNARSAPAQNWINLPTGIGAVLYGVNFSRRGLCSELYLSDPNADTNTARFAAAEQRRTELEAAYGSALTWEALPGRKGCRIAHYRPGNIEHVDAWEDHITWFLDAQTRLRAAVQNVGGLDELFAGRTVDADRPGRAGPGRG